MYTKNHYLSVSLSLFLISSSLLLGCSHNPTTPRTDLLTRAGIAQSAIQLRTLLYKAQAPQFFDVSFDADSVHFSCAGKVTEKLNSASGFTYTVFNCNTTTLTFTEIDAIEIITPDNYMNIYGHGDQKLLSIMPENGQQMRQLIDLLASFRQELAKRGSLQLAQLNLRVQRKTITDRSQ
ncbi:MAG: hypothetical protein Tsb0020_32810 [Haliangiales bacterium]